MNETLSFCFAVRNDGSAMIERPRLRLDPPRSLTGSIDESAIAIFQLHPVPVGRPPGWVIRSVEPSRRNLEPLDVLVPLHAPLGGMPSEIRPGATHWFWVDLTIPKGSEAGTYAGAIHLTSEETNLATLPVELTVWPFVLPDEDEIPFVVEVDHSRLVAHHVPWGAEPLDVSTHDWTEHPHGEELRGLLSSTMRLLQQHRLTPTLPWLTPPVVLDKDGRPLTDWAKFDEIVEPFIRGRAYANRVRAPVWPLPLEAVRAVIAPQGLASSPTSERIVRSFIHDCAAHFRSHDWLGRAFAVWPEGSQVVAPEPEDAERRMARILREVDSEIRIALRRFPQDMKPLGWADAPAVDADAPVDIWVTAGQFFDPPAMAAQRDKGRQTWLAVDRPPYSGTASVYADPADTRVLSRQAKRMGAGAVCLGTANAWPEPEPAATPETCVRWDPEVLLYPGTPFGLAEPVPSVRLKYLRQSQQDAALGRLLDIHRLDHLRQALDRAISPYAGTEAYRTHFADGRPKGWASDGSLFELARRVAAGELLASFAKAGGARRSGPLAEDMAWRSLMTATERLEAFWEGSRVRLTGTPGAIETTIESRLVLRNALRTPWEGSVRVDLPEGWSMSEIGPPIRIPPHERRGVLMAIRTPGVPVPEQGRLILPIELVPAEGPAQRTFAAVPLIVAVPRPREIRIDGDLSDWPQGTVNVAGDFRPITGANPALEGADSAPRNETLAFVMSDATHIYIAFHCAGGAAASPDAQRRKHVEYEDMVPVGEELVEVLIDPLNAGTRMPSDLYHVVVKRGGGDVTEKGARTLPVVGTCEPWPVDLALAVKDDGSRWMAELRIPFSAFETSNPADTVWGFNVTRYDAQHHEYSTWSGAKGTAYDPLSLGNLYLPR
jgi:hypothetical protein